MDRIKSICIEEELCQSHDGSLEQILKQMLSYKKLYNFAHLILANAVVLPLYSNNDKSHLCAYAQTFPNLILLQQQMPL